jgi:hypothetical protein
LFCGADALGREFFEGFFTALFVLLEGFFAMDVIAHYCSRAR